MRPAETLEGQLVSNGEMRFYRMFIPASEEQQPLPLLINLHGLGGDAATQEALSRMSELAAQELFMVVYPEGIWSTHYQGWQIKPDSDDVTFIRDLVAHLQAQYAIDETMIYATGLSNGGAMAERLACDAADLLTAVAPVNGAYSFYEQCMPSRPISIVMFHGRDDPVVPYTGTFQTPHIHQWAELWAERNGCGSEPIMAELEPDIIREEWPDCAAGVMTVLYSTEGSGHAWPGSSRAPETIDASQIIGEFLLAQKRPK